MASLLRYHWAYVILQCLILNLLLCRNGTFADKNKYYHISTLCSRERQHQNSKKIDGAVVSSKHENNLDCSMTFQTDSILQRFMLRFDHLALDCHDHLTIFDGAHALGNYKADLSCRSTRAEVGTIFTRGNFITLRYRTNHRSKPGNGFSLVITAIKTTPHGCKDFRCLNNFCISQELTCDSVNHCGDNSDETSYALCVDESVENQIMGIGLSLFVAIVVSIFLLCCICILGTAICLCRRTPQNRNPPIVTYPISQMDTKEVIENNLPRNATEVAKKSSTSAQGENWFV